MCYFISEMLRHVFVREIKPHKKCATTLHSAKQAAPDMRMSFACLHERKEGDGKSKLD